MTRSFEVAAQARPTAAGETMSDAIAEEVTALVRERGIQFQRGEVRPYFRRIARLQAALTLPVVPAPLRYSAILLKCLYSLWNFIVDDAVDRDRATGELDASMVFIVTGSAVPQSGACAVLQRIADITPGGRVDRASALGFDLLEVTHGLCYEHLVNSAPGIATTFEYRRYSTMTASLKVLLDIDWMFCEARFEPVVYRTLREAYDELTCAVKYASDIGTLRREVHDEDSMNLLRILARGATTQEGREPTRDDALAQAQTFTEDVAHLCRAHLQRAEELFSRAAEVDARGVLQTMTQVSEVYLSGVDPFFS